MSQNLKQVIVMRKDLGMKAGKMVAQGAHASVLTTIEGLHGDDEDRQAVTVDWLQSGMTKIVVQVDSGEELLAVHETAHEAGLFVCMVTDAGRTAFHAPTVTCIAIGPDVGGRIDSVTGHLRLL